MPIDIRQFVKNRQQRDLYLKSLRARCSDDDDVHAQQLDGTLALQETVTSLLNERNVCKSHIRKGLITDKRKLNELEGQLKASQTALQEMLWKLPNWVDHDVLQEYADPLPSDHATPSKQGDSVQSGFPQDPLFCARCYEDLGHTTALVGVGSQLATAINQFIIGSLQKSLSDLASDVSHWNLSYTLESLSMHQYHDLWGCSGPSKCTARARQTTESIEAKLTVPSWFTILRNEYGTYWDRQLPKMSLLSCTSGTNDDPVDAREVERWGQGKKKPWYQRLAVREKIQIVVVAGPCLDADSRPLQQRIVECVRDRFQQLIGDDALSTLRIRAIPAAELLPMESSRLIIEGYVSSEKPVCLAYLSNLRDYCTGPGLRHGTTKEGLHVLQGNICNTAETMEWLCRNRAEKSSFTLPRVLLTWTSLPERLMYTRNVAVNKNGKRLVEDIVVSVSSGKSTTEEQHVVAGELTKPNAERIRAEALSSSFGFFPFHCR
jgi:hypothetical protein